MKLGLYSIKDSLSGQFSQLVPFQNKEIAKRWFRQTCLESKIKNDLQLFYLGSYDIETGVIESKVEFVIGGSEVENG